MKYNETYQQFEARLTNFTYHAPHGDQGQRYESIRDRAGRLALTFNQYCPPSRELSLAMTKLEEAVFWANAAIARNEVAPPGAADDPGEALKNAASPPVEQLPEPQAGTETDPAAVSTPDPDAPPAGGRPIEF